MRGGGMPCEYDGDECGGRVRVRGGIQRGGGCDELSTVLHVVVRTGKLSGQFYGRKCGGWLRVQPRVQRDGDDEWQRAVLCVVVQCCELPGQQHGEQSVWRVRVRGGIQRGGGCDELSAVLHVVVRTRKLSGQQHGEQSVWRVRVQRWLCGQRGGLELDALLSVFLRGGGVPCQFHRCECACGLYLSTRLRWIHQCITDIALFHFFMHSRCVPRKFYWPQRGGRLCMWCRILWKSCGFFPDPILHHKLFSGWLPRQLHRCECVCWLFLPCWLQWHRHCRGFLAVLLVVVQRGSLPGQQHGDQCGGRVCMQRGHCRQRGGLIDVPVLCVVVCGHAVPVELDWGQCGGWMCMQCWVCGQRDGIADIAVLQLFLHAGDLSR